MYTIEEFPGTQRLPFADQVCCVLHWNGYACNIILSGCWAVCAVLWIMTCAVLQRLIEQGRAIDTSLLEVVYLLQQFRCCCAVTNADGFGDGPQRFSAGNVSQRRWQYIVLCTLRLSLKPPNWDDHINYRLKCAMHLCLLQFMLDRSRAVPGTDISVIFTSGALDRLAAALQAVFSYQNLLFSC